MATGDAVLAPGGLPDTAMLPAVADADFDRMADLARRVIGAPLATVTLVTRDAQIFPGAAGLEPVLDAARTNALSYSICRHVVARAEPLVVADATTVVELADNDSVTELGIRAYAGMPLRDADGVTVGSLCVMDHVSRTWSEQDVALLTDLAAACESQLQLRQLTARAAVSVERDRIGSELQRDVVTALFRHSMNLGNARSQADGELARQLTDAIDDVDAIIVRLRNSIHSMG